MIDDRKIESAANKHIETEYARYNSGDVEEEMICLRGKDSFKAGVFGSTSPRLDTPKGNIPSDKQKCQLKEQHEFTIKGIKIMEASE